MKKILSLCLILFTATTIVSCDKNDGDNTTSSDKLVKVTVHLDGFEIFEETRSTALEAGVKRITFSVFDNQGTKKKDIYQKDTDDNFGCVTFELPAGNYTMAAEGHTELASNDDYSSIEMTNNIALATISSSSIGETFCGSKSLTVADDEDEIIEELPFDRVSAKLQMITTMNQPSNAKKIEFTIGDPTKSAYSSYMLNVATGYMSGLGTDGCIKIVKGLNPTDVGSPTTIAINVLIASDGQKLPVTVEAKTSDGEVISSHTVKSVPFHQNAKTTIKGPFYAPPGSCVFQFNTDWNEDIDGGW